LLQIGSRTDLIRARRSSFSLQGHRKSFAAHLEPEQRKELPPQCESQLKASFGMTALTAFGTAKSDRYPKYRDEGEHRQLLRQHFFALSQETARGPHLPLRLLKVF